MSLIQKLFGNAVEASPAGLTEQFKEYLVPGEKIVAGYRLIRDIIVFTNERLILVDIQGITGSKVSYTSIPFSSIKWYSMETAGTFDFDSEIKLSVQTYGTPLVLKFKKGTDLKPIYTLLSTYILRDN